MAILRGTVIAFGVFLASFLLHIVGGASHQGWLFAIAVALIFVSATAFPSIAGWVSGIPRWRSQEGIATLAIGAVAGYIFTTAALWAANGRAFAWWEFPLALVLVGSGSAVVAWLRYAWLVVRGKDQPRRMPHAPEGDARQVPRSS